MLELNTGVSLVTAYIDLMTGFISTFLGIILLKSNKKSMLRNKWSHFLGCLGISNFLGGMTHLFKYDEFTRDIIWIFIFPILFEMVLSLFNLSIYKYTSGQKPNNQLKIIEYGIALIFNIYQTILGFYTIQEVRIFVVYATLFGLPAFILLIITGIKKKDKDLKLIILTFICQLIGLVFQIFKIGKFHFIIDFDYNVIYHLFLFITIIMLYFVSKKDIKN